MQNRLVSKRISSLFLAGAIALSWSATVPGLANAGSFRLNATESGTINAPQGLGRGDMVQQKDDAFSGGSEPAGQPEFGVAQESAPPPPKRPLNGNVDDQGGGFNPAYGRGMPGQLPSQPPMSQNQMPQQQPPQFQMQQADPDSKVAWDEWHHRVAAAIYDRYHMLTRGAGYGMRHTPLQCDVTYVVTSQGQVMNAQVAVPSRDPVYNTLCVGAITSLSGNFPVLQFPPGSRRQYIEMPATFTENINGHKGFQYLQGDQETVRGGRR